MSTAASPNTARLIVLGAERREIILDPARTYAIGRSAETDLRFENDLISRRHALLEPSPAGWRLVDCESTNGTAVDDEPLAPGGSRLLESGAEISLGDGAVRLLFERSSPASTPEPIVVKSEAPKQQQAEPSDVRPGARKIPAIEKGMVARGSTAGVRLSDALPFLSKDRTVLNRSFVWPGIVTVIVMLELLRLNNAASEAVAHDSIRTYIAETTKFIQVLGGYAVAALAFAVVATTGRRQAWWIYAGSIVIQAILLLLLLDIVESPFHLIAGLFGNADTAFGLRRIAFFIIGVGFPEELIKAIPLILVMLFIKRAVRDPLDGVGIAVVAAAAFVFIETVFQYVPGEIEKFVKPLGAQGVGLGFASGLELLVTRVLGSIAGHLAWSGYLGYAIVLGVQRKSWQLVLGGWTLVAVLHGLWDASTAIAAEGALLAALFVVATVSFVLLFAAIRRGRRISGLSQPLR